MLALLEQVWVHDGKSRVKNVVKDAGAAIAAFPGCKVLIDHMCNPKTGMIWEYGDVLDLAKYPNVYMKMSGLGYMTTDAPDYPSQIPFTRRVIKEFGADRMVWSGDSPHIADVHMKGYSAADIAKVCAHLATRPHQANPEPGQGVLRRLVLGQAAVTVNQTVASLCRWRHSWIPPWGLDLQGWLIDALIGLLRIEITPWDLFSIRQRHFIHEPITNPERFGLVSTAPTLAAVFETAGLSRRSPFQPNVSKLLKGSTQAQSST